MNKRQVLASLNNIANALDNNGLYQEASSLTKVMKRLAQNNEMQRENETQKLVRLIIEACNIDTNRLNNTELLELNDNSSRQQVERAFYDLEDIIGRGNAGPYSPIKIKLNDREFRLIDILDKIRNKPRPYEEFDKTNIEDLSPNAYHNPTENDIETLLQEAIMGPRNKD